MGKVGRGRGGPAGISDKSETRVPNVHRGYVSTLGKDYRYTYLKVPHSYVEILLFRFS